MNSSIAPLRYLSLLAGILLFSCNSNPQLQEPVKEEQSQKLSMKNPVIKREAKIFRKEVKYIVDSLKSRETIDSLLSNYNDDELKTVLAINRIEKNKLRPNRPLVIPECAAEEFNNYASWILPYYFNFMNFEGVGVHQYALPGYPASHGCVRLYMDDAKYIFDWASMWELENSDIEYNGTPFMVFGEYDHSANKPWLDLKQNMKANDLTQDELNTIREYVIDYQEDPKNYHNIVSKTKDAELADA